MGTPTDLNLRAHLTEGETLAGKDAVPALRSLLHPEVRRAFAEVELRFLRGDIDEDELLSAIVEAALVLRVAIERRFLAAGASTRERRMADDVDRALGQCINAVPAIETDDEEIATWLRDLRISSDRWWGYLGSARWELMGNAMSRALERAGKRRLPVWELRADVEHDWRNLPPQPDAMDLMAAEGAWLEEHVERRREASRSAWRQHLDAQLSPLQRAAAAHEPSPRGGRRSSRG